MASFQTRLVSVTALAVLPLFLWADEKVDLSIVNRIRAEAFGRSKVMDVMFYLTDVYGPRLTNSPNFRAAGDWAVQRLKDYGLMNVKEEKWGPFGRGWQCRYFEAHMVEPQFSALMGIPLAWTEGTSGSITGEPILAVIRTEADMEKYKGKLRGKIVMTAEPRELPFPTNPEAHRYTDAELTAQAEAPDPAAPTFPGAPNANARRNAGGAPNPMMAMSREERQRLQDKIAQFMKDEGVLLVLSASPNGMGGAIFAASGGSYDPKHLVSVPGVGLMPEQYNRIARLLEHKIPVKLDLMSRTNSLKTIPTRLTLWAKFPAVVRTRISL